MIWIEKKIMRHFFAKFFQFFCKMFNHFFAIKIYLTQFSKSASFSKHKRVEGYFLKERFSLFRKILYEIKLNIFKISKIGILPFQKIFLILKIPNYFYWKEQTILQMFQSSKFSINAKVSTILRVVK